MSLNKMLRDKTTYRSFFNYKLRIAKNIIKFYKNQPCNMKAMVFKTETGDWYEEGSAASLLRNSCTYIAE